MGEGKAFPQAEKAFPRTGKAFPQKEKAAALSGKGGAPEPLYGNYNFAKCCKSFSTARARWLIWFFTSSPNWENVLPVSSGMKTGS